MSTGKKLSAETKFYNQHGYLRKWQLAEKHGTTTNKITDLIEQFGLPYSEEFEAINEEEFNKWLKENKHLIKDRRKGNEFYKLRKK